MRWTVTGLVALAAAWCFYAVSPYYALYQLARAVEAGDVQGVAARVNMRALRYSLARQIAAEFASGQPMSGIASSEAQIAAGAAVAMADPLLDRQTEPAALIRLLRTSPTGEQTGTAFGRQSVGIDDLDDFLAFSSWRGFRTVYVHLPPGAAKISRFRLQLRLSNLRWRVVSLDLPSHLLRRLVEDMKARTRRR